MRIGCLEGKIAGTATVGGTLSVKYYEEKLLETAESLIDQREFCIAVVVAHMACEVAVERALSRAYKAKNVTYLEDWVSSCLNGYNMGNSKVRNLYVALTGHKIQGEGFWRQFTDSTERRNKIVHTAFQVAESDARNSLCAARALVGCLK
jgi:hypothetical protein